MKETREDSCKREGSVCLWAFRVRRVPWAFFLQSALFRYFDMPGSFSVEPERLRRLLLSLTEIEIRQDRFDRAECIISELLGICSNIAEPDVNDRVGHIRTLIARSRVSQLCEAEEHWNAALLRNRAYNRVEKEVFTCGMIYLFISSVRFQLDDVDGSRGTFKKAIEVIRRKRPQFLMPNILRLQAYIFVAPRLQGLVINTTPSPPH
jgi:tetratricopeptide (TPR) repeat protein